MKKTLIASCIASALVAGPALAGPQQGVRCPDGFQAQITDGNRKLVCKKTSQVRVEPVCSPLAFSAKGIAITGNVVMDTRGPDKCLAPVSGQTAEPVFTGLPVGATDYTVTRTSVDPNGTDTYMATVHTYAFPERGPMYVGDAKKGVSCPSGYDGDKVFDARGIRCDRLDGPPKLADCDGLHAGVVSVGWRLAVDHRGNEDRCVPTAGGSDGPTKPEGMTKAQHDAERARDDVGWVLEDRNGRDRWQRKVYVFPRAD
ncbi:MAG: hypothetical protein N2688_02520 [Burkholderiaceae bacterium]|nr:hypothetical protein [Burkholderiaceae bacterium]